jgi:hypothetical protein
MVFDEEDLGDVVSISVLGSDDPLCGCGDLACAGCPEGAGETPGAGPPLGGLAERMLDRSPTVAERVAAGLLQAGLASRMLSVVDEAPSPPARPTDDAGTRLEHAASPALPVEEPRVEEIFVGSRPSRTVPAGWTYQPRTTKEAATIELHARLVHARRRLRSLAPGAAGIHGDSVMEIPKRRAPRANVPTP